MRLHSTFFLLLFCIAGLNAALPKPVLLSRVAEIATMIPDHPQAISPTYKDRAAWENIADMKETTTFLKELPQLIAEGQAPFVDSIYLDYSKTGRRELADKMIESRGNYLFKLVFAECIENKGTYIPEIEKAIISLCKQTPWTLSAHDKDLKTYSGEKMYVDLVVATFGFGLAESLFMLDDKIAPEVRELALSALHNKLFAPIQNCISTGIPFNWFTRTNNWNSVCLAGLVGAANAVVQDKNERALYIALAEQYHTYGIDGYEDDGYCSEGVGYYNYGFRSLIALRELVCRSTRGKLDFFTNPKLNLIAQYGYKIHIINDIYPLYSDARPGAKPGQFINNYCNHALGYSSEPEITTFPEFNNFSLNLIPAFPNQSWPLKAIGFTQSKPETLRSYFPQSGVYVGRPAKNNNNKIGVSAKGGTNGENHNHNDIGSYVVVMGKETMSGDQGCAITYTRDWFENGAYEKYKSKGSYGHPVPLINNIAQKTGKEAKGVVLENNFTKKTDTYKIDMLSAYRLPELSQLTRTFVYDRKNNTFVVTDILKSNEEVSFECAITTRANWKKISPNTLLLNKGGEKVYVQISCSVPFKIKDEVIEENAPAYTRIGIVCTDKVRSLKLTVQYSTKAP